jgi:hypothetical protein
MNAPILRYAATLLVAAAPLFAGHHAAAAPPTAGSANTVTADPPVPRPKTTPCVVTLFSGDTFADYTPKPFTYAPPSSCPGPWAKVVLDADFAVTAGRQFDRTANVWIGGTNVFFGTTPEPSRTVSPSWHVERDLTDYAALFGAAQPGEIVLGNTVNATYTGVLSGGATLSFYPLADDEEPPQTPDLVLPLAAGPNGETVSLGTSSSTLAKTFTLPTNVERAYLDVIAQSQGNDEFWYTCVPDDVASELQTCGSTGFRETEITIDGAPAGVAPVYPWIYTGGIDPYLWRPIPGVEALNLHPFRVDLTPFAGVLSDGQPHTVAIRVFSANNYFSATGTLLLFLDRGAARVTGEVTVNTLGATPTPTVSESLSTAADGTITGTVAVSAARAYVVAGHVDTSHGRVHTEVTSAIRFSNRQTFDVSSTVYDQTIAQATSVVTLTTRRARGERTELLQTFDWPVDVHFGFAVAQDGSSAQKTTIRQEAMSTELLTRGDEHPSFHVTSNVVAPTDTLAFDASGALTGPKDQSSSQRYLSIGSRGGCYLRTITAAGGVLTGVTDGCEP